MGVDLSGGSSSSTPKSPVSWLEALENGAQGLGQSFGTLLEKFFGERIEPIRDGQLDLMDRADLLSPLLDYGSTYLARRQTGNGVLDLSSQIGPMRGCRVSGSGIQLLDKGLWDIRFHQIVSYDLNIFSQAVEYTLQVITPSGEVFSQQSTFVEDQGANTHVIVSSVVVPEPGYRVQVRVSRTSGAREHLRGPKNSRLVVQHISRETHGQWGSGSEDSDSLG